MALGRGRGGWRGGWAVRDTGVMEGVMRERWRQRWQERGREGRELDEYGRDNDEIGIKGPSRGCEGYVEGEGDKEGRFPNSLWRRGGERTWRPECERGRRCIYDSVELNRVRLPPLGHSGGVLVDAAHCLFEGWASV